MEQGKNRQKCWHLSLEGSTLLSLVLFNNFFYLIWTFISRNVFFVREYYFGNQRLFFNGQECRVSKKIRVSEKLDILIHCMAKWSLVQLNNYWLYITLTKRLFNET
jgi:hypothetical protein